MFTRRKFMVESAATATLALLAPGADAQTTAPKTLAPCSESPVNGEAPTREYFSEQRLYQALGTSDLSAPPVQVIAYNFPSWHPSPYMEKYFGKGWTEYDTLRNARSLFPGHSMPHYPLWGYYDEADPEWAAREIELAASHGIDAWMIDWYWHSGTQFYQEQLEHGLLQAPNREKIKFAVMWANHDWKNVYPAESPDQAAILLPQRHSLKDFEAVANYCCDRYFGQPNYLKLNGRPVFAIFDAVKIKDELGEDGLKRGLDLLRQRTAQLGHGDLHLQVSNGYGGLEPRLRSLGFDSATLYGTFGWTYERKRARARLPYGTGAYEAIGIWRHHGQALDVPFYPTCSVGWDDSPRYGAYSAVAIDRSPDQFERLVRAARHEIAKSPGEKLIYIGAWNEWTEDSVLLPDSLWGYSYLEALKRAART